ncbi:von Willebrand factor type A domain-containing protein [Nannocystis exedens]|uniref:von Willebrand factor type A domain-containing protein n=1 Tax=Nannocystis exedens TaxID=54 RepID=A0A1I2HZL3_9BACT|nr:VWA domain-containing protein [Nannocystis exedens]PCC73531.1 von Willebrand factor type A domain protein [Nannocystis exedens]SFF35529.1 von Willebrand factor type A domain-containing protein [Nannocystis exedens]
MLGLHLPCTPRARAGRRGALILPLLAALTGACGDDAAGGAYDSWGEPPEEDPVPKQMPDDAQAGEGPACDTETPMTLFLSPDDSNSTSSPVQAREAILSRGSLDGVPLRTWEFLNYYSFAYPKAEPGQITVTPELTRVDGMPEGQYLMQIGVAGEAIGNADRRLMSVTLVLDESGSMDGVPMQLQQEVCRQIAGSLRAGDVVSVVGWDTENAVKLAGHPVTGADDPALVAVCNALAAGGGTDLHGGLSAGYELARKHFDAGKLNRVVLVSDGGANAGVTDAEIIAEGAGAEDQEGIYLVGVGVGDPDSYNDALMDTVTDVGRGASLFIPSADEARRMFRERFVQTMSVAARDVRVRLEMPPGFSIVKFSGEEYSADPADVEPQHLAPDDAMVFHQTIETCAPAEFDPNAEFTVVAQWKDAVTFAEREVEVSLQLGEVLAAESALLKKGAAVFEYAEALKALRADVTTAGVLDPAFAALARAEAALPGDADLAEIRRILEAL